MKDVFTGLRNVLGKMLYFVNDRRNNCSFILKLLLLLLLIKVSLEERLETERLLYPPRVIEGSTRKEELWS